jgi:putative phosphoesterase
MEAAMRRIGIISDVHGYYEPLLQVLEQLEKDNISEYIILGDIVKGGPEPARALRLLRSKEVLSWVRGNTDEWIVIDEIERQAREAGKGDIIDRIREELTVEELDFLRSLPAEEQVEADGYRVWCCHGSPRSSHEPVMSYLEEEPDLDCDILLCGHTHRPSIYDYRGTLLFNIGSAGMADTSGRIYYGILELEETGVRCVQGALICRL